MQTITHRIDAAIESLTITTKGIEAEPFVLIVECIEKLERARAYVVAAQSREQCKGGDGCCCCNAGCDCGCRNSCPKFVGQFRRSLRKVLA